MNLGIVGLGEATEIGFGGSATVYSARRQDDGAEVAVKILNMADPSLVERFEREGQVLTTLSRSPRIVTVHEAGSTDAGRPYLVLDLCESSLLDRIEDEKNIEPIEACRVLADVTEAVADAHLIGVVHRDIKPANILQSPSGDYLVADFGISTVLGSTTTTETVSTSFTAGYVAPETLGGDRAGAPADVYALGATLFHMVTGAAPFATEDGEPNIFALANRVANEPLPDLRSQGIPEAVCRLIESTMAKDPDDRPDAVELQALLTATIDGAAQEPEAAEAEPVERVSPPEKPSVARLVVPPELSRYSALELVDRLDGASVFLGRSVTTDTAPTSATSEVAVRVFDVREFDPGARKVFRSDRLALAEVTSHQRLVPLLDHGYTADGRPYDVEANLGENTLSNVGDTKDPFAWPRMVEVGIMAASAVATLHQAGFAHGYIRADALFRTDGDEVAVGDYRAISNLSRPVFDAAAAVDLDLQALGKTLLSLAGVTEPAVSSQQEWAASIAATETLGIGPRSLQSMLVSLVADDAASPPATAFEVAEGLQRLQTELALSETPLLVARPELPVTEQPGEASTATVGIDPTWAPPEASPGYSGDSIGGLNGDDSSVGSSAPDESVIDSLVADSVTVGSAAEPDNLTVGDVDAASRQNEPSAAAVADNASVVSEATETAELTEVMAAYHAEQAALKSAESPSFTRFDPSRKRTSRMTDLIDDTAVRARSLFGLIFGLAAIITLAALVYVVSQRDDAAVGEDETQAADATDQSSPPAGGSNVVTAIVPLVAGLKSDAAVTRLENAGFDVNVNREFDPLVPRGQIVSSEPTAGETAEVGSRVVVVVSRGSEPSCIGSTEPAVRRELEDRDLTVAGVTRSFSESLAVDRVIRCVVYDDTETAIIVVSDGPRSEDDG